MPNAGMMQMFAGGFAPDSEPDAFSFTDVTGQSVSSTVTSNSITVTDINVTSPITITGGMYSINGGGYTSAAGTVSENDTVTVQVITGSGFNTAYSATVTIGGVSDTFTATTITAASVSYITRATTSASGATWNAGTLSIGTAASNRRVIVATHPGYPGTVTSVTIGGISATQLMQVDTRDHGTYTNKLSFWIASVPTGTTANVTINYSGAHSTRNDLAIWAVYSNSTTVSDTAFTYIATPTAVQSLNIDCPAGGVIIGYHAGSGRASFAWTNLTEDYDALIVAHDYYGSGASNAFATTQTNRLITLTGSGGTGGMHNGFICMSIGP